MYYVSISNFIDYFYKGNFAEILCCQILNHAKDLSFFIKFYFKYKYYCYLFEKKRKQFLCEYSKHDYLDLTKIALKLCNILFFSLLILLK